jgi:hypothetical protein
MFLSLELLGLFVVFYLFEVLGSDGGKCIGGI